MKVHHFASTGEAYDACQCDENIKDGDTLIIRKEKVVGVAWTWPYAVSKKFGKLHTTTDGCAPELKLVEGHLAALAETVKRGW